MIGWWGVTDDESEICNLWIYKIPISVFASICVS